MSLLPRSKLHEWIDNVPDYYDMTKAYQTLGELRAQIIRLKREIERVEEQVSIEEQRPRSNEARSRRLQATSVLKDSLADFEAQTAVQEALVKSLEYRKSMFSSAAYTAKIRLEVTENDYDIT
jgi:midasin (ATPase involved in ribosome maturation)